MKLPTPCWTGLALVLDAPIAELMKVPGVGENAAVLLHLIPAVSRFYQESKEDKKREPLIFKSTVKYGNYLQQRFVGRRNETVFLLCMDAKCKVLCCANMGEGSVNSASVPIRRIVETALGVNATTVILAHNHPSGLALPSGDDIQATKQTATALELVGITLFDHIVVAEGDYVSMLESGLYRPSNGVNKL